jgi:hypothetical protein
MIKLFFSYSHKDEDLRNELDKHLSILKRQGTIETWHDRRINAGKEIDSEINKNLKIADIILLLVSSDFLASDYCYDKEMHFAMQMHTEKKAVVIPVILRPCDWRDAPFGKLLASPKDGKPVIKYASLDDAFLEISEEIKKAAKSVTPKDIPTFSNSQNFANSILPRSSNLRIAKKFTDQERDNFLDEAFEYIANYFEGSLKELVVRNPEISFKFKRLDSQSFSVNIYTNGEKKNECLISYGSDRTFSKSITYSNNASNIGGGFNESFSIQDDGYLLSLKPIGMSFRHQAHAHESLTFEGAAEYYWQMLIEPLQRGY